MQRTCKDDSRKRRPRRPPDSTGDLLAAESLRNRMIATSYYRDGYSIREIARAWPISRTHIGRIVLRMRRFAPVITRGERPRQ